MSISGTTPPSQEGGVDGFGLFASILPSHCMYLLMCRSSSSRYIYLYYVSDTRMHAHMSSNCLCMPAGILFQGFFN